jgi:hypothetical protein
MKNIERIAEELFDKIRSRFEHVVLGNEKTDETDDPEQARFFNFDYVSEAGTNYGNITLSLIDEDSLKVYFSNNLSDELAEDEAEQQQWYNFLKGLRFFAKRNLLKFDTRDISRSNLTVRDLKHVSKATSSYSANEVPVIESRLYGSSRISIQEFGPVRLVVRHSESVNEEVPGARSRKIDSIFIETDQGERFRMPFKKLSAGRAMAEHMSHGGYMHDDAGQHIVNMVEEMANLSFFVRNTKHRMFEDTETQQMVEAAIERYQTLRTDLKRMSGPRGYQQFAETFEPEDPIEENYDLESLKDRFVKKMFDDRLADALPYVHRAHQQRQVSEKNQYIKEFDNWADDIADHKTSSKDVDIDGITVLMQKPMEVGIDGIDAINSVKDFIPSDDDLFNNITQLSRDYGNKADARPTIDAWLVANDYPSVYVEEPPMEPPVQENPELGSIKRLAGI